MLVVVAALAAPVAAQPAGEARVAPGELPPPPELPLYFEDPASQPAEPPLEDDIVSGAARREQSLGNVASAVTVISVDRLRRFGYRTVAEAIAGVAGVHLVDDRLATRVGIRGMQPIGDFNTRILVVIDGTSVTEAWSHLSGVGYDLPLSIDEVERIEVIRGPVSSIYGTNAFFGIINVITRGALPRLQAWGRAGAGQIGGLGGSAGFAAGTPSRQVRGAVSVNGRRGESTRYQSRDILRDKDSGLALTVALSAVLGPTFAQLRAYSAQRLVPFAPYGGNFDQPYQQTNSQVTLDVGHARQWGKLQLSGRVFASAYRFSDRLTIADPASTLEVEGNARTVGAEVRGRYPLLKDNLLWGTSGIEATYNDTFHSWQKPDDRGDGGLGFGLLGLYAELESVPTRWLGVTAGVRFDRRISDTASPADQGNLSPRLAVFLSRSERAGVKLLYAEGFRNPSTYESIYNDDDIKENKDAEPESVRSFEAVAWAKPTPALSLRASLYHWVASDVLKQVIVQGDLDGLDDVGKVQYQNKASYRSIGVELEARLRDQRGYFVYAAANVADVEDDETDGALAGAPRITASLGVSSQPLWAGLTLSSELMFIGERLVPVGDPLEDEPKTVPRHLAWNAALYLPSWRGFDLTLGVRNLLGRREQVPAAEDFLDENDELVGTVPGEGRELYVRLGRAL